MFSTVKDPSDDLDYSIDWSTWLVGGDTISVSSWAVPQGSGLVLHTPSLNAAKTIATTWVRGGVASPTPYMVTNTVTTAAGRVANISIFFSVQDR